MFASDFVQNASNYVRPDLDLKIKPLQPGSVSLISFFLADILADLAYLTEMADNKVTQPIAAVDFVRLNNIYSMYF